MYKPRFTFKNIIQSTNNINVVLSKTLSNSSLSHKLNLRKVLVLTKLSLYECERKKYEKLTDAQFEKELRKQRGDFDRLSYFYHLHKEFEHKVINNLRTSGIDVKVANRCNCSNELVEWADVLMPTGGDGTFLLAASKIRDNRKPVIGFNSDPTRSEGHLCLSKRYSENVGEAIKMLQMGEFNWLLRTRIRITLFGLKEAIRPTHLHLCDNKYDYHPILGNSSRVILPYLALNEVFIGECLSARVSYLEVSINDSEYPTNMKCSGLCITTGTGSTSWHLSMNQISAESIAEILRLANKDPKIDYENVAASVTDVYNKKLIYEPDDKRMSYTIRDLISAVVWPQPKGIKSRDFCSRISIKSKCIDACLVVDGGISIPMHNACTAVLETHPEDSLLTVILPD